ncbi:hypothetical protein IJG79_00930 [Candidatus Saccharibacteria bacterium]|nr:hypothetical protein [Candidatus Saccharibacteria bacterium]
MKEFFKSRIGRAVSVALSVMIVWAICTPVFDVLFRGGIKSFDLYRYVIEPILIGLGVGIFEYIFKISDKRKNHK